MATKINNSVLNLLKQYLPTTQADNTRLGTQKSNATAADVKNMDYLRALGIQRDKAERASLDNARLTMNDESIPFTFPTGEKKKWSDMDFREKNYVKGQSLRTKGRINEEGKETLLDYVNPLNWYGKMAASAAESPYMAKQTNSVMPYVMAGLDPLIAGRMMGSGTMNPLSKAFYTKEVSNPEFVSELTMGLAGGKKPYVKNVAESDLEKRRLFDYNRAEKLKELDFDTKSDKAILDIIKNDPHYNDPSFDDLKKNLAEKVKDQRRFIDLHNPKYEVDKPVRDILEEMLGRIKANSRPERVLNFMSDEVRDELEHPSLYGRTNRHRLPGFLRDANSRFPNINLVNDAKEYGAYYATPNGLNTIGVNPRLIHKLLNEGTEGQKQIKKLLQHELQHHYQRVLTPGKMDYIGKNLKNLDLYTPKEMIKMYNPLYPKDEVIKMFEGRHYFDDMMEKTPMLSEVRSDLVNKNIIPDTYSEVTPDMLEWLRMLSLNDRVNEKNPVLNLLKNNRVMPFVRPSSKNYKTMADNINKLLGLTGVGVGTNALIKAANKKQNQ